MARNDRYATTAIDPSVDVVLQACEKMLYSKSTRRDVVLHACEKMLYSKLCYDDVKQMLYSKL